MFFAGQRDPSDRSKHEVGTNEVFRVTHLEIVGLNNTEAAKELKKRLEEEKRSLCGLRRKPWDMEGVRGGVQKLLRHSEDATVEVFFRFIGLLVIWIVEP